MDRRTVSSLRGAIGRDEIERLSPNARAEIRVYYPYHSFVSRSRGRRVHFLVDARTGLVATADPYQTETREVAEDDVLAVAVGADEARQRVRRHAARTLSRSGNARIFENGLVYKPFWILSLSSAPGKRPRMLVDGITGRVHPLGFGAESGLAEAEDPVP
ncbi:MAG TPA: hypothetical protein VEK15_17900 [Vicinamibacteria bacterium]|nr:hypothetical protein [Vicinamibacteria bacterium]